MHITIRLYLCMHEYVHMYMYISKYNYASLSTNELDTTVFVQPLTKRKTIFNFKTFGSGFCSNSGTMEESGSRGRLLSRPVPSRHVPRLAPLFLAMPCPAIPRSPLVLPRPILPAPSVPSRPVYILSFCDKTVQKIVSRLTLQMS